MAAKFNMLVPRLRDWLVGGLVTLAIVCWNGQREETSHFKLLVSAALGTDEPEEIRQDEASALALLHTVNKAVSYRESRLNQNSPTKVSPFWTSEQHWLHPKGACASYTATLAKALKTAGFPIRKVGLSKNGLMAIHHLVEAKIDGHWVVLDGIYDLAFRNPSGQLASAKEVGADWAYYSRQAPANYNPDYDYSGFYYTNWDRIPIAGWVFGKLPSVKHWLERRETSIRFVFLDVRAWEGWACLTLGMLLSASRIRELRLLPGWRALTLPRPVRTAGSPARVHLRPATS